MAIKDYRLHMISFEYQNSKGYCCVFGNGGNLNSIEYIEVVEAWCKEWRAKLEQPFIDDGSDLV